MRHDEAPWITSSPFSTLRASLHALDCRALHKETDLLIEHPPPAVATDSATFCDLLLILTHNPTNPHSIRDLSQGRRDLRSEALQPNMADSTMSDADKVNTSIMEDRSSLLTLFRSAQSVLPNLEAPRAPLLARRQQRSNHQRRRPQIRTQYLRHLRSRHRSQPLQHPTAPISHKRRVNPAHPKSRFNLARYHQ
jgi:hypothetical protein